MQSIAQYHVIASILVSAVLFQRHKMTGICWHAADPVDTIDPSEQQLFPGHVSARRALKRVKKSSWSASGKPPGRPTDNPGRGAEQKESTRATASLPRPPEVDMCTIPTPLHRVTNRVFSKRKTEAGKRELGKCLYEDRTSKACTSCTFPVGHGQDSRKPCAAGNHFRRRHFYTPIVTIGFWTDTTI